jgi:AraC family transcriptional regulator
MYRVEIAERPASRVIGIEHRGAYNKIGGAFERLGAAVTEAGLWPEVIEVLGLYPDDPSRVPEAELRSLAGIAVGEGVAAPRGFAEERLAAGRYAVLHHRGPYEGLPAAWGWLRAEWLPKSGATPRAGVACEVYRNAPGEVPPEELLTDVCLPVA